MLVTVRALVCRAVLGVAGVLVLASHSWAGVLAISWTDYSVDEDGFSIERRSPDSPVFAPIATAASNTVAYLDRGVPAGGVFCYRVRAFNQAGVSDYTNESCGIAVADASPVRVTLNQPAFHIGDSMVATVRVTQDFVTPVDTYVVMQTPGGLMSLQIDGRLVPGLVPIVRGVVLPTVDAPFAVSLAGAVPGTYVWMAGVTQPGTLALLAPIASTAFTVAP